MASPKYKLPPFTQKRNLPNVREGESVGLGTATLYDAFIESLWKRQLDEYRRKEIGFGDRLLGKEPMDYPDKEVWWDDPRSRLELSREYHKYYSEEDLEKERLLREATDALEKEFFDIMKNKPATKSDIKVRPRGEGRGRIGGGGIV